MSIKSIKCPNCGGSIQIEDSLEKGFCMYCGGAIMVQDEIQKIKIEHTGKVELTGQVKIDESGKANNFLRIATEAFNTGNFQEAYAYYNKVLECDFENTYAFFRRNLCAAHMSFARVFELEKAIHTRVDAIYKHSTNKVTDIYNVFKDVMNYINKIFFTRCNQDEKYEFDDIDQAKKTFDIIATITRLCSICVDLITNEMMHANKNLEQEKKNCIDLGIRLCKRGLSEFRYLYEHQSILTIEAANSEIRYETLESPHRDFHKNYLNKFKNDYNNLPSVVNAVQYYESEKLRLQKNLAAYNNMLNNYFAQNPDIHNQYKKKAWPFVLITIGSLMLGIALSLLLTNILTVLTCLSATIFLMIFSIVKKVQFSNERKKILDQLPQEIKNLKQICDENKKSLERAKQIKESYTKSR